MADLVEVIQSEHFYEQFQIALSLLEQIEARLATIDARLADRGGRPVDPKSRRKPDNPPDR